MDIGGNDFILPVHGRAPDQLFQFIEGIVREHWPEFVVEADENERFYYRNEAARRMWEESGRTNDNDDQMLHVICASNTLTLVGAGEVGKNSDTNALIDLLANRVVAQGPC